LRGLWRFELWRFEVWFWIVGERFRTRGEKAG
jgi:hypothetical protein